MADVSAPASRATGMRREAGGRIAVLPAEDGVPGDAVPAAAVLRSFAAGGDYSSIQASKCPSPIEKFTGAGCQT
jgi:hypothetical protein